MESVDLLPAWQVVELFQSRELRPVEYVTHCLDRITALEPELHAFITVAADSALTEARRVEDAIGSGQPVKPLSAIPIAVKDEVWTKGIRSTAGSVLFQNFVPDSDATVIERMRDKGAIVIGKANMPEFASFPRSGNAIAGECVNPLDPSRISGASSGGSAAAIAAGMVPLAIGSDGGGSIRIPASLCGVVGLFPTPGLVPARGTFSYSPYASLGPMGRDVRDVALLLEVIAGHDRLDPTSFEAEAGQYVDRLDDGVRGLRVAWSPDFGRVQGMDPRMIELAHQAAQALERVGAVVDEPDLVFEDTVETMVVITGGAGAFSDRPVPYVQSEHVVELVKRNQGKLSPHLRARTEITAERYERAARSRDQFRRQLKTVFETYDLILSPTMAETAPLIPSDWVDPYQRQDMGTTFTGLVNITENCAASMPCGRVDGLPVGVQVMGAARAELTVLRACRVLEQAQN